MALRPAYGFTPYGFRGLPAGAGGYGFGAVDSSRFVVIVDKYGGTHAAELGDRESAHSAAKLLAEDLGLDKYEAKRFRVVRARDAGEARRMPLRGGENVNLGDGNQLDFDFGNDVAPPPARRRGVSRKPGRVVRCKIVKITQRNGKVTKRKLCWDKHGVLARNTKAGARGGKGARKVVCKRKCKNGGKAVCIGGYRKVKGRRVCKKFVCRKRAA